MESALFELVEDRSSRYREDIGRYSAARVALKQNEESKTTEGSDSLANLCFQYAVLAREGLSVYESIKSLDKQCREYAHLGLMEFDEALDSKLDAYLLSWADETQQFLKVFDDFLKQQFEQRGIGSTDVENLRDACQEVRDGQELQDQLLTNDELDEVNRYLKATGQAST